MSAPPSGRTELSAIARACQALGSGPLTQQELQRHIWPLFAQVLDRHREHIYLANHSLGRPLDQTAVDVQEALELWYSHLEHAWDFWLAELASFRTRIATLIQAPRADCIVPKTSAGQGLRAVLNSFSGPIRVVTTGDEFNSIDLILKQYAAKERLTLQKVAPRRDRRYYSEDILANCRVGADLLVLSQVFFTTGQSLAGLPALIAEAHQRGLKVLVDLYHAAGAVPVDVRSACTDFAIGGSYKYLRGGTGACWLYIAPTHLDNGLTTLDTGWFAQRAPFAFQRPEQPDFAPNGDAWLESTPAVLPLYQARAGLELTLALGVERLRAYSHERQALLAELLGQHGIAPLLVEPEERGAFLAIPLADTDTVVTALKAHRISCDAREGLLRLCPDILTTEEELVRTAQCLGEVIKHCK